MRTWIALLASVALAAVLGACSQAAQFSIDGSYAVTIIISETNTPGTTVGDVEGFAATFTTIGEQVEMTSSVGFVLTGTRSGNSVMVEGTDGGTGAWIFDLTWTSDTDFEGDGRFDDGPEFIEFEAYGFVSPLLPGE